MRASKTIKDIVYQEIMNGILSSEYKPNDILTERELTEKYGYSKSPVREALVKLCNEHVLISHPRYGYEVVRLTDEDVKNILEFRFILESALLKKSFDSIGPNEIAELRRLDVACQNTLKENMWIHWEANTNFHLALASYSNNIFAQKELDLSMLTLKRAYAQFYWKHWTTAHPSDDIKYHKMIIQSLEDRDLGQCLVHLKDDLNDFRF